MFKLLRLLVIALGTIACAGSLLSLTKGSHWMLRLWDFPRVQIATAAGVAATAFRAFFFRGRPGDWGFLGGTVLCLLWQARKIVPFTRLAPVQVKLSPPTHAEDRSFTLLISNVLMENQQHDRLIAVIRKSRPDLILVVETDARWERALQPLRKIYPHVVACAQANYYGMLLFSRFPLINPKIEYLVQEDIPSIHTSFELPSGDRIWLHGLHPRPPEPIRDQDSTPRDAELVLVGRGIHRAGQRPTVVAGDLNDVAWSPTTELFLRLSGLLDPRVGRGFFNSFHADHWLIRYPLDHVFHSNDFQLVDLRRLEHIGSDHFPMLIRLCYEPRVAAEQPKAEADAGDYEDAEEKVQAQAEAARTGDDRPSNE
jgi:endonuclease/exonuclease/phosphatase (EEP) superfamily protein YafD